MTGRLVELAGPAGSGKTTLVTALCAADPTIRVGLRTGHGAVAAGLLAASPTLLRARTGAPGRWWTTGELRAIGYLAAWQRPAGHRPAGTTLLDHGPTFRLASLLVGGPPMVRTRAFHRWWMRTSVAWGLLLDTVVWLDAADEVLIDRIRERDRDHRVREASDEDAGHFLAGYRTAYDATLDVLLRTGMRVVRIDTSAAAPDVLAATLAHVMAGAAARNPRAWSGLPPTPETATGTTAEATR